MGYGKTEFAYAQPIADALSSNPAFCAWVLRRTKFQDTAETARILCEEMWAARAASAQTWWRSHFSERCRCNGCSGQETDLLAIFDSPKRGRFSVHFEVKHPDDKFPSNKDQAKNYQIRSECWIKNPPKSVLRHSDASTVLLCSSLKFKKYELHLGKFGSVIAFQDIAESFPDIAFPSRAKRAN